MDGMFEINNFSPSIFDKEEVSIIHQNVEDIKLKQFTQAVIEIKLSKAKFGDLVTQLYRDKEIIEKLTKDKILYIGFINSNSIDDSQKMKVMDKLNELNCIIFGTKNSIFSKKKLLYI